MQEKEYTFKENERHCRLLYGYVELVQNDDSFEGLSDHLPHKHKMAS